MRRKLLASLATIATVTVSFIIVAVGLQVCLFEVLYFMCYKSFHWEIVYWPYVVSEILRLLPYATLISVGMFVYCYISVIKEKRDGRNSLLQ